MAEMGNHDGTAPDLPELGADESFQFDCGPHVPCFNRCCADLALPLTPYDVLRIGRQTGPGGEDFLRSMTLMEIMPESGFPLFTLRMIESPDAPCPFVTPAGCSIYEDRPGACRSYPLGRGAKLARQGIAERFFIVREEYCHGFCQGAIRKPGQWLEEQGLKPYIFFNDRYMRLISMVAATKKPLDERMTNMVALSLYRLNWFRELIQKMGIFKRVVVDADRQGQIMDESLAGDEACLAFALDWLELAIFGKAPNLDKKE